MLISRPNSVELMMLRRAVVSASALWASYAATAGPLPCPDKLPGSLTSNDPTLLPSDVIIIRLNEIAFNPASGLVTIWPPLKTIQFQNPGSTFPIGFEFDISDLNACPLGFEISTIGDSAAEIDKFHYHKSYQMRGEAQIYPWNSTMIPVYKPRSRF